jgi:hypothetical protein
MHAQTDYELKNVPEGMAPNYETVYVPAVPSARKMKRYSEKQPLVQGDQYNQV